MRAGICFVVLLMGAMRIAGIAVAAESYSSQSPLAGPSFDCTRSLAIVEKLICSDPELSKLDMLMSDTYREVGNTLFSVGIASYQSKWLRTRRRDCGINQKSQNIKEGKRKAIECLKGMYGRQIVALEKAREYELLDPRDKNPPGTLQILGKWITGRAAFGGAPWYDCTLTIDEGQILFRGDLVGEELAPIHYSMVEHTASHAIMRVEPGRNTCVDVEEPQYWRFDNRDYEACQQDAIKRNGNLLGSMCAPRPFAIYKSLSEAREHIPSASQYGYWWYWGVEASQVQDNNLKLEQ